MQFSRLLGTVIAAAFFAGCAKYDFTPVVPGVANGESVSPGTGTDWGGNPPSGTDGTNSGGGLGQKTVATARMNLGTSQATFTQSSYGSNDTSVSFQVTDGSGNYINTVDSSQLTVTENGVTIPGFSMTSNPQAYRQTVDIAFMLDVTCSMKPTINSAKTTIVNFINNTRAAGYHTRMCLSTFGDYVVQKCDRFYDNDPSNPATMTQVNELIALVSSMQAGCGAADPGGPTLDENPISAILDVEKAPWAAGSQRFGILMTDAGFLYSPGNDNGLVPAPTYVSALASLAKSQMNIFLAAPSKPGYNQTFSGNPSLVGATMGEFFLYSDLISGNTTFNTILNRIMLRVQTTYSISYTADTIPGLDPALPMNQRTITVTPKNGNPVTIKIVGTTSSMPDGRAQYTTTWKLSDKQISANSAIVKVNNVIQTSGYSIVNGQVVFTNPPPKGANISVDYQLSLIKDALNVKTVVFAGTVDINKIAVFLNGVKAKGADVYFEKNLQGSWVLYLNATVLAEADTFKIRQGGGLDVEVVEVD